MYDRIFKGLVCVLASVFISVAASADRVVLIGDSITFGRQSKGFEELNLSYSYARLLPEYYPPIHRFHVAACGGMQVRNLTSDPLLYCANGQGNVMSGNIYDMKIKPYLPAKFVSIMLGTNDSIGWGFPSGLGVATAQIYEINMRLLVQKLRDDGAYHVQLITPPYTGSAVPDALIDQYHTALTDICNDFSWISCGPDFRTILVPRGAYFDWGSLHPNIWGHIVIGLSVQPEVDKYISR